MPVTRKKGIAAEEAAKKHLEKHGLKHLQSNYSCRSGEIDLVMRDRETIVFVEVRYRGSSRYGSPVATVDYNKQLKLQKTALHYLQYYKLDSACRFDVVGISGKENRIEWIKNAFYVV